MNLLFVCSRNQWRSPTAEEVYRNTEGFDVRSAGNQPGAKNKITSKLILWADIIFVMEKRHKEKLLESFRDEMKGKQVVVLDIPDEYEYMDEELVESIKASVEPFIKNHLIDLHSAGAIVHHQSPFQHFTSHRNEKELSPDFIKEWCLPFYMKIGAHSEKDWIYSVKAFKSEITREICLMLLGDFNWRTRLVGAYFAAVKGYDDMSSIIGTHMLKSEVCCVGHIYPITLASFNREICADYLQKYLDYYLTKPSLHFDQRNMMEAMLFLARKDSKIDIVSHLHMWDLFQQHGNIAPRPLSTLYFENQISILENLRRA